MLAEVIYLLTNSFNLVYRCSQLFDDIKLRHVTQENEIPIGSKVLTDLVIQQTNRYAIARIHCKFTDLQIKTKFISLAEEENCGEIVFGIDPGASIGLAVLYNGIALYTTVVISKPHMVIWIREKMKDVRRMAITIKIGDGWKEELDEFITIVAREFGGRAKIETVNEERTSNKIINHKTIHEQAAISIAKRDGNEI